LDRDEEERRKKTKYTLLNNVTLTEPIQSSQVWIF